MTNLNPEALAAAVEAYIKHEAATKGVADFAAVIKENGIKPRIVEAPPYDNECARDQYGVVIARDDLIKRIQESDQSWWSMMEDAVAMLAWDGLRLAELETAITAIFYSEVSIPPLARKALAIADGFTPGVASIAEERRRQIEKEGWSSSNDDVFQASGEMAVAASCYAFEASRTPAQRQRSLGRPPKTWPFKAKWWKPTTPIRDLEKAGALIAAEIDRLRRAGGVE